MPDLQGVAVFSNLVLDAQNIVDSLKKTWKFF